MYAINNLTFFLTICKILLMKGQVMNIKQLSLSPPMRDMFEMELYYRKIGDEYALWMIEQLKEAYEKEYYIRTYAEDLSKWSEDLSGLHNLIEDLNEDLGQ